MFEKPINETSYIASWQDDFTCHIILQRLSQNHVRGTLAQVEAFQLLLSI